MTSELKGAAAMDYATCFRDVIRQYAFIDPCVEFIRHNENIAFKLTEKGSGDAYLLRMHKPITENMRGVQTRPEAIRWKPVDPAHSTQNPLIRS